MPYPKEELLHHIWQHRLFSTLALKTADGQPIELIRTGELNSDAGPDFRNARLKVGKTEWVGNVEIHIRASDWLRHQHQSNPVYSNIILHVVFENDLNESVGSFPTLELKNHISDQLIRRYENLCGSQDELPCGDQFLDVPEVIRTAWLDSLLIARLQRKSKSMDDLIERYGGDLEQAFMAVFFRSFGMKVNAEPFQELAERTPWKVLARHQNDLFQLEAILFGNAGFLAKPKDDYQAGLKKEYEFILHKYSLEPMEMNRWKFLRLRPANFPSIRLAQLAEFFHVKGSFYGWFSGQEENVNLATLRVEPSAYWKTHYQFGLESKSRSKCLGTTMAKHLLINAVAPFLFVSAEREAREDLRERALSILQHLPAEENSKVKAFMKQGLVVENAAISQALIELRSNYCDHKKCLFCGIGAKILKRVS